MGLVLRSTGGVTFNPVQGARSMWMAAYPATRWCAAMRRFRATATAGSIVLFESLSRYFHGPTPNLDMAFKLKFDSEPSYDGTALEYTTDCSGNGGWTEIDGGHHHRRLPPAAGAVRTRSRLLTRFDRHGRSGQGSPALHIERWLVGPGRVLPRVRSGG
jgi:hypothetical protein